MAVLHRVHRDPRGEERQKYLWNTAARETRLPAEERLSSACLAGEAVGKTSGTDSALVVLLPVLVGSPAADPARTLVQMPRLVGQSCLCLHFYTGEQFRCSIPQPPQAEQGIVDFFLLICNSPSGEETTFCA